MNSPLSAPETSAGDEASLRLRRALEWEATERMPGSCPLLGVLIQIVLLSPWLVSIRPSPAQIARPASREAIVRVFVPAGSTAPAPPKLALAAPGSVSAIKSEPPSSAVPALTVDLNAMRIEIADDVDEQLPEVARQNGGTLALLDMDDPAIARYILQPPSWDAQEGVQDISRKFRLTMTPPSRWRVFRDAAGRYGIDLSRYPACAIFDGAYRRCLMDAIRSRAWLDAPGSEGRVSFARLAFAAGSPCGIRVLEVKLAHHAAR